MSLGSLATMPQRARGRPRINVDSKERSTHIKAVWTLLASPLKGKQIAAAFGVSRTTLYRWRDTLLGDGEADTEGLRRLPDKRPKKHRR